jgi:hypothetical protein
MSKLKLAELQDDTPVKLTVELPAAVHRDLVAYAEALSGQGGRQLDPAKLVVPMVARFMNTDRAFARLRRKPARAGTPELATERPKA